VSVVEWIRPVSMSVAECVAEWTRPITRIEYHFILVSEE
jgi:hypothetical protein